MSPANRLRLRVTAASVALWCALGATSGSGAEPLPSPSLSAPRLFPRVVERLPPVAGSSAEGALPAPNQPAPTAVGPKAPSPVQPVTWLDSGGDDSLARRFDELEADVAQLQESDQKRQDAEKKKKDAEAARPTGNLTAQLQADFYSFSQDANSLATLGNIQDGSAFRRARFGWLGEHEQYDWRVEMDFALAGRPSFLDVFAGMRDVPLLGYARVGHFFEPFSLERLTPNRFVTFLERSLPDQPFAPARNLGAAALNTSENERLCWAYGVFRSNSNFWGDDAGDGGERAFTGRITGLPKYDEASGGRYYIHLGAGYSYRSADDSRVRFQSQPEARLGANSTNVPFFVDTGNVPARAYQLFGAEAAWVHGPLSIQSEYMWVPVDRLTGPSATFQAFYVTTSYFLTGEHRPYRKRGGFFDRVVPFENFFAARVGDKTRLGRGAWELAFRVSHLDLNDAGVLGGRLTDLTAGLNWYLTPYCRWSANYVRAMLDDPTQGDSHTDIFGMRVGYDF